MFTQALSNSTYRKEPQSTKVMNMNGKKAVIVISLMEESTERSNREIEREIKEELSRHPPAIPWLKNVEKVTVTEA